MTTPIHHLHAVWNRTTGQHVPLGLCSYELEFGWHQFIKSGHTEAELIQVVAYLVAEIRKGKRKPAALRWRNCIGDTLRFAEELQLARGEMKRKVPETPLGRAMRQLRPTVAAVTPDATKVTAVPISHYIEALRNAANAKL